MSEVEYLTASSEESDIIFSEDEETKNFVKKLGLKDEKFNSPKQLADSFYKYIDLDQKRKNRSRKEISVKDSDSGTEQSDKQKLVEIKKQIEINCSISSLSTVEDNLESGKKLEDVRKIKKSSILDQIESALAKSVLESEADKKQKQEPIKRQIKSADFNKSLETLVSSEIMENSVFEDEFEQNTEKKVFEKSKPMFTEYKKHKSVSNTPTSKNSILQSNTFPSFKNDQKINLNEIRAKLRPSREIPFFKNIKSNSSSSTIVKSSSSSFKQESKNDLVNLNSNDIVKHQEPSKKFEEKSEILDENLHPELKLYLQYKKCLKTSKSTKTTEPELDSKIKFLKIKMSEILSKTIGSNLNNLTPFRLLSVTDKIKNELKKVFKYHKLIVNVTVGESEFDKFKMGFQCYLDHNNDVFYHYVYSNESIHLIASAFAIVV